jgi:hypothetical protein
MMKESVRKIAVVVLMLLIAGVPVVSAMHDHGQMKTAPAASGANPLIEEMVRLDEVFRDVVSAVALGDGERAHKALESMHGAMEKTHEGVHAGTVRIPKNADKVEEFVRMDKEFHDKLESLAQASHKNDVKNMVLLTQQLIDECVRCHSMFRK